LKQQALDAIDCIEKKALTELELFTNPTGLVGVVISVVVLILSPAGKPEKDLSWKPAKKLLGNTSLFIIKLQHLH
jgi:hypothetical protein